MNVSRILNRPLKEHPEKTAIIFEDRRLSYAELDSLIDRAAAGFLKLGLHQGDVLSLFLPSLPELIIGYLGTVRAGLIVNVVNAMLKEQEVGYILKDCRSRAVLVDAARLPIIEAIRSEVKSLTTVIPIEDSRKSGGPSLMNILKESGSSFDDPGTKGSDTCHLMYTSGTTGWPKGVMATHLNIWHNAVEFGKVHFSPRDTIMVATPIFHCWGLINGTFGMLSRGGTVITVERFYPEKAVKDIERLRPTIFIGVPPMYNLILKQPDLDPSGSFLCGLLPLRRHQDAGKSHSPGPGKNELALRRGLGPDRGFLRGRHLTLHRDPDRLLRSRYGRRPDESGRSQRPDPSPGGAGRTLRAGDLCHPRVPEQTRGHPAGL